LDLAPRHSRKYPLQRQVLVPNWCQVAGGLPGVCLSSPKPNYFRLKSSPRRNAQGIDGVRISYKTFLCDAGHFQKFALISKISSFSTPTRFFLNNPSEVSATFQLSLTGIAIEAGKIQPPEAECLA
jgi:hypothetical protein